MQQLWRTPLEDRDEARGEAHEVHPLRAEPTLRPAPRRAAVVAVTTWGRNSVPYCVFERSYSEGSVRMVLAAGNVTSAMPCTTPAA